MQDLQLVGDKKDMAIVIFTTKEGQLQVRSTCNSTETPYTRQVCITAAQPGLPGLRSTRACLITQCCDGVSHAGCGTATLLCRASN
jgi:hypothetical protein